MAARRLAALIAILAIGSVSGRASADVTVRTVAAASNFHGELSHERARPTYFVGARYALPAEGATRFGLGFDVLSSTVHQRLDAFPYEPDQRLDVLAFLVLPHVCRENVGASPLAACAGLGLGTVNVNSPSNRQDYGTWHYEAVVRGPLGSSAWSVEAVAKYVGKVEQRVEERDAAFWLIAYGLGVARAL